MKKKTLKALEGSIKKWKKISAGKGLDLGTINCPLCQIFYRRKGDFAHCEGCPVKKKTGKTCCYGTPYERWWKHRADKHSWEQELISLRFIGVNAVWAVDPDVSSDIKCPTCQKIADAELEFLKGLLPK
jgi:hypothetical protein